MAVQRNKNSLPKKRRKDGPGKISRFPNIEKRGLITKHHIIPLSRGGSDDESNRVNVLDYFHQRYHWLFSEMNPNEILSFLESYFWKGDKSIINNFSENRDAP